MAWLRLVFFAQFFAAVQFWQGQREPVAADPYEDLAAAGVKGFTAFQNHFVTLQLASLFGIPFLSVRALNYDQAMNMLVAESKLSAYRRRLQDLRKPAKK